MHNRKEDARHDKNVSCFITTQTPLPREWSSLNIHFIFAGSPHTGVMVGSKGWGGGEICPEIRTKAIQK